jgi:serine protease Do
VSGEQAVSIADVAEQSVPSVVNISATKTIKSRPFQSPFFRDPFFREFFGDRFHSIPKDRKQNALGSGVIVSTDGIILTNNHVVEDADEVRITLSDGRDFKATIVGADPESDVAVLRLKARPEGLVALPFGDSASLRLGEVVIAIGNPFGVGQTVTMGIVSALGRGNVGIVDYEDFIQTDAAINPGNSGGALVNMRGELVGINTAILSRSGGYQGVGFAIPAHLAEPTMHSLLRDGKVVRGWLGVAIQDLNEGLADAMGLKVKEGVLVSDVTPSSPASKAGLKRGDVIVAIDGKATTSTSRLRNRIAIAGPKTKVLLEILRDGKTQKLHITLGELTGNGDGAGPTAPVDSELLGVTVAVLDRAARQKFSIPEKLRSGVVVTKVDPASRAAQAGVRPGDVVVEVNQQAVKDTKGFRSLIAKDKAKTLLLINRKGMTVYVAISH